MSLIKKEDTCQAYFEIYANQKLSSMISHSVLCSKKIALRFQLKIIQLKIIQLIPNLNMLLVVPEKPSECSITNNKIVNGVDNISFALEWPSPHPNGILVRHNVTAHCTSLDTKATRPIVFGDVRGTQLQSTHKYILSGLQKHSECTVHIAGATATGVGEFVSCSDVTPLTSMQKLNSCTNNIRANLKRAHQFT